MNYLAMGKKQPRACSKSHRSKRRGATAPSFLDERPASAIDVLNPADVGEDEPLAGEGLEGMARAPSNIQNRH